MGGRGSPSRIKAKTAPVSIPVPEPEPTPIPEPEPEPVRIPAPEPTPVLRPEPKPEKETKKPARSFDDLSKLPNSGPKLQQAFIDYIKYQTGIDLEKARDPYFDTRRYFNIDFRNVEYAMPGGTVRGMTAWHQVLSFVSKYDGGFDIDTSENGPYRIAVFVSKKKSGA